MKTQFQQVIFFLFCLMITFSACKKKEDPKPDNNNPPTNNDTTKRTGKIAFAFANTVNGDAISMNSTWYRNEHGDSFQVTKFNYYISNIKLHNKEGGVYATPESYQLIQQEDLSSLTFTLDNVPAGNYTSVSFLIGVDSIRNVSGAQTGALDPVHGMFWDWNTGYIMAKFEGNSPQSSRDGKIVYHIGGFSGAHNPLKQVSLTLPQEVVISGNSGIIAVEADLAKWFKGAHLIDFGAVSTIHMPNANSRKIADNYVNMFRVAAATYSVE